MFGGVSPARTRAVRDACGTGDPLGGGEITEWSPDGRKCTGCGGRSRRAYRLDAAAYPQLV